ncbi:prepilin peptidase [Vibrio coralliirubri]|uniref:prepilin peptidase n=1 Tax=Vibrio coralliirubri TaxID=1516159 RepID=UPI000A3CEB0F|nr:prepilin peptidase [Vibrio coralliirubri]
MYLVALAVLSIYVSVTDFLYRKIQNYALYVLLFLQCFISPLDIQIMSFLLMLGGGLILYKLIWIGAGDIKYAVILSLTIPFDDLLLAYILTAFAGGILAVTYLMSKKVIRENARYQEGIPYGIAISIGFYLVILTQSTPHI